MQIAVGCWLTLAGIGSPHAASQETPPRSRAPQSEVVRTEARGEIDSAYFDGNAVAFTVVSKSGHKPVLDIGPWHYGERVRDARPKDVRPNVYLVSPGQQHHNDLREQFDHNTVINLLPASDVPAEWDVYWAIVLDPALHHDFRSERELLLAAQSEFTPGDLFEFSDVPGRAFLRSFLLIDSLGKLKRFRHKNGRTPRLVIVRAGFTIRATAGLAGALP